MIFIIFYICIIFRSVKSNRTFMLFLVCEIKHYRVNLFKYLEPTLRSNYIPSRL